MQLNCRKSSQHFAIPAGQDQAINIDKYYFTKGELNEITRPR